MTMSLNTGLASGINTGDMITQLMSLEAASQNALKTRLSTTQTTANSYRTVNTALQSLTTAADAALKPESWSAVKGTSTSPAVAVTTAAWAQPGALTFTVAQLATTASSLSTGRWASTTAPAGLTDLDIRNADGSATRATVALDGTESLEQIAAKINTDSSLGLRASAVQVSPGQFALAISASTSGEAAAFRMGAGFTMTSVGQDAELVMGTDDTATGTTAYRVTSTTNTFEGLLPGVTLTVDRAEPAPVTVSLANDPDAVAGKLSALVDAVNNALTVIKAQTNNTPGSRAALRGEYAVSSIGSQLLDAVAKAVGTDGSAAQLGLELTRDGKITFSKEKFGAALEATPDLARRMISGSGVAGEDGYVAGIAGRIREVATAASDATTGTLTSLAKGQDGIARDIQDRIAAWDLRLAKRKEALTRQFTAMETALSSLSNQSNWLAGQLGSLQS